jgi:alpha-acetolactate decarboxylase
MDEYQRNQDKDSVTKEISELFEDHEDLQTDFFYFLTEKSKFLPETPQKPDQRQRLSTTTNQPNNTSANKKRSSGSLIRAHEPSGPVSILVGLLTGQHSNNTTAVTHSRPKSSTVQSSSSSSLPTENNNTTRQRKVSSAASPSQIIVEQPPKLPLKVSPPPKKRSRLVRNKSHRDDSEDELQGEEDSRKDEFIDDEEEVEVEVEERSPKKASLAFRPNESQTITTPRTNNNNHSDIAEAVTNISYSDNCSYSSDDKDIILEIQKKKTAGGETKSIDSRSWKPVVSPAKTMSRIAEDPELVVTEEKSESKVSCNVVRRNINMYLATDEMSSPQFVDTIGSDMDSFNEFMSLNGKDKGQNNKTYIGALKFFEEREQQERAQKKPYYIKKRKIGAEEDSLNPMESLTTALPPVQTPLDVAKLTAAPSVTSSSTLLRENSANSTKLFKQSNPKPEVYNLIEQIRAVVLPNETNVYDDCDEIRRKISLFIAEECGSIAKFSFAIRSTPATVDKFLSKSGKDQGN